MQCTNLGGMEQVTLQRMISLGVKGFPGRLVSLNPIGELGPLLDSNNVPAVGLAYRGHWGWKSIPSMWREFRREVPRGIVMTGHNLAGMVALGGLCKGHRLLCVHYHHQGVK